MKNIEYNNKKQVLIITDMQNDFVLPEAPACVEGAYRTIGTVKKLLDHFRKQIKPVIFLKREYRADGSDIEKNRFDDFMTNRKYLLPGTEGCKIIKELTPVEGEYVIIKKRFSGFMKTELDLILRRLKVRDLVICGTQYPNCIRATAFDGISLDYNVTVITDATSAASDEIAETNIRDMKNVGINCISLQEYLREDDKGPRA
ncbi:MAG TPA: isochorismatase family cysteine hydrolase [Bacteroidales bacterium]|nr:isochorismatase family cysteine hydrolase [Bacteroidales bacterium]